MKNPRLPLYRKIAKGIAEKVKFFNEGIEISSVELKVTKFRFGRPYGLTYTCYYEGGPLGSLTLSYEFPNKELAREAVKKITNYLCKRKINAIFSE